MTRPVEYSGVRLLPGIAGTGQALDFNAPDAPGLNPSPAEPSETRVAKPVAHAQSDARLAIKHASPETAENDLCNIAGASGAEMGAAGA
jgi:hypothetical protein